jgi:geranylgeranyl pyrophosphate synthase
MASGSGSATPTSETSEPLLSLFGIVLPIVETVRASGAVDQALAKAREFVTRSQAALHVLPDNDARQAMLQLADYVVARSY